MTDRYLSAAQKLELRLAFAVTQKIPVLVHDFADTGLTSTGIPGGGNQPTPISVSPGTYRFGPGYSQVYPPYLIIGNAIVHIIGTQWTFRQPQLLYTGEFSGGQIQRTSDMLQEDCTLVYSFSNGGGASSTQFLSIPGANYAKAYYTLGGIKTLIVETQIPEGSFNFPPAAVGVDIYYRARL